MIYIFIYVLKNLISNIGTIIVVAYFISRFGMFKNLVTERKNTFVDKLVMSVIFGVIGIIATYAGVPVKGAIANSRIIGVFVGGIYGGPLVGMGAGIIAGVHRWAIDIGGFTAVACAVSTIIEGLIGGFTSRYIRHLRYRWMHSLIIGTFAEVIQMIIILVVARPVSDAVELVKIIWVPMVIFNPIGIALFVAIIEDIYKEQEKEAAQQTELALDIAEKCLPYLRRGIEHVKSIEKVANIILDMSGVDAVAITNRNKVIVHLGVGHEYRSNSLLDCIEGETIRTGEVKVEHSFECNEPNKVRGLLKSAVVVPLVKKTDVIGTVVMYKTRANAISFVDLKLAEGLARLFSTQLELADIDQQIELRQKAELKALQSQINPHFLFNALNTIVSFCRTKPEKARELLISLSDYFRNTLQQGEDFVSLDTELKHVDAYLKIERARFGERLKVEFSIEEDVDCMLLLPQLILQPIVENAIKHGIRKVKGPGCLSISLWKAGEHILIAVEDTGEGIDQKIVERLYSNTLPKSKVGLANVHNRLKSIYGDEYGLKISRTDKGGTRVEIKIPLRIEGE